MTPAWLQTLRRVLIVLFWGAVVAAPFVQHAAITTGRWFPLAIGFAAIQAIAVAVMAWHASGPVRLLGLGLGGVLVTMAVIRISDPGGALSTLLATTGVSHTILYCSLLLLFGRSLRSGRTPFVTSMARRLESDLTPAMVIYTRHVTQAWCCVFAGQLLLSGLLFTLAPHEVWSLFVNVLDGPLVAMVFAVEYGIRRLRFRHVVHVSPLTIIRNFSRMGAVSENG
jgi:uncharacterized membrane protein